MKYLLLFSIFFIYDNGFCQSSELFFLKGKVICSLKEINDIKVANLRSESSTVIKEHGDYSLFVKVGDTLAFSGLQIETKKIIIQDIDVQKTILVTTLVPNIIELDEVQIKEYKNINAVSLGILQKPAKHFTPAERKLNTASNTYPTLGIGTYIGGSVGLDPLLNWISGRTAMLKKEVEIEKQERLMGKLENQFGVEYCVQKLKIPQEYVKGFWYYAVQDPKLAEALNGKNKTMATFVLSDLATKYKSLQKQP